MLRILEVNETDATSVLLKLLSCLIRLVINKETIKYRYHHWVWKCHRAMQSMSELSSKKTRICGPKGSLCCVLGEQIKRQGFCPEWHRCLGDGSHLERVRACSKPESLVQYIWGGTPEFASLTRSQEVLLLFLHGAHSENLLSFSGPYSSWRPQRR